MSRVRGFAAGCSLALLLAAAGPAGAESVLIGGAALSPDSEVGYLGWLAPLPGEHLANGFAYSLFGDYVGYRYDSNGRRIEASAPGAQAGLSKQFSWAPGALSLGAIAGLRHTRLSPDDPGNHARGWRAGVGPQLQWRGSEQAAIATRLIGNWVSGRDAYYVKGYAGLRLANGSTLGPEAALAGDSSYQIRSFGIALHEVRVGPLRVGFSVGMQEQKGLSRRVNGGLEFSWYRP